MHIPFVAYWPKQIPAGTQSDALVSALDILPTALKAAGIAIPAEMRVDGKDILPVLAGKEQTSPHQYMYWAGPGQSITAMRISHSGMTTGNGSLTNINRRLK